MSKETDFVISLSAPTFDPEHPDIWFSQLKNQLQLRGMNKPITWFQYAVSSLSHNIAVPLRDTFSSSVAKALIKSWIYIFSVPSVITTDRESQFTSTLLRELNQILGSTHIRTTAYHPEVNGLLERFHRQLKSVIIATSSSVNWVERLPIILLSIRSTVKEDLGCCPAELVLGTTLIYLFLRFVRVDTIKKPLQPPYDRPYKVLKRKPKYFILDRNGTNDSVSIDRSKSAHVEPLPTTTVKTHLSNSANQPSNDTVSLPFLPPRQLIPEDTSNPVGPAPVPSPFAYQYTRRDRRVTFPLDSPIIYNYRAYSTRKRFRGGSM
nr:gag pol polyprotein [Hymenolepis microstoma]